MPKPPATDADIIKLTDELTWMGGDPAGIAGLLREKQFTREHIQSAIAAVMSRHSCVTTYNSARECESILEAALTETQPPYPQHSPQTAAYRENQ